MGAIATGMLAIVTLIFFATDRLSFLHHHTPAEMGATLTDLTVSPPVTIAQYLERTQLQPSPASLTLPPAGIGGLRRPGTVEYVAQRIGPTTSATSAASAPSVSSVSQSSPIGRPPSVTTSPTGGAGPPATSGTPSTSTTSTTSAPSTTSASRGPLVRGKLTPPTGPIRHTTTTTTASGATPSQLSVLSLASVATGPVTHQPATTLTLSKVSTLFANHVTVNRAIIVLCKAGVLPSGALCPAADVNTGGTAAGPGVARAGGGPDGAISEADAEAILTVFRHTRMVAGAPVGVIVNFHVTVNGYVGKPVTVRWSLWSLQNGSGRVTQLPEQWLVNRPVDTLIEQADSDSASPEFWIPLPTESGRFEVEIAAYTASGERLADEFTPPFS